MNDLKNTAHHDYEGEDYDTPAYGDGPMEGFAVNAVEADGEYLLYIKAFFAADSPKQAKYRVSYPKQEKADRIIAYELGGNGWIEEGQGATPFAKSIGAFIQQHFS